MNPLKKIKISGYKSLKEMDLEFHNMNILIGSNGAGKSNLLAFFEMLLAIKNYSFQNFVTEQGGANILLYNGRKVTSSIKFALYNTDNMFHAIIQAKAGDRLYFASQGLFDCEKQTNFYVANGFDERKDDGILKQFSVLQDIGVYHFHDTSVSSPIKASCDINDNIELASDGRNLAAILYRLKATELDVYERIVETIRLTAPYFQDFVLRENPLNPHSMRLEWKKVGCDIPFGADQLSDGTLRFICLTVLLCLPPALGKNIILIDEPELGLHPFSLTIISELMRKYAMTHQVIVATQSVEFLNEFRLEDIITVETQGGASVFKRLDVEHLKDWLDDYTIGELWQKNVLGGRP